MAKRRTVDVFGIQRDVPANYVTRPAVDDVFVESLTRDKHIVVYGSSKQGKTSLRKYNLEPTDYVTVVCSNSFTLAQLHSVILKAVGYKVEQSSTKTFSGESKINATLTAEIGAGGSKVGSTTAVETTETEGTEVVEVALELDPEDVNDIIRALEDVEFDRLIVLEDFHYLPIDTQEAFSVALKAFHEQSDFTFIIVGVWLDENRLIQFNGDLTGRVLSVDADAWSKDELLQVIDGGEMLLNVRLHDDTRSAIIDNCFDSVYIVQEACYRTCVAESVHETLDDVRTIGEGIDVPLLIREIVEEQSARYGAFLNGFAGGFQETELEMFKWMLLPLLMATPEEIEAGMPWNTLRKVINANHPKAPINQGNLTQSLGSVSSLQVRRKITPIVVDYDHTAKRLDVVDRGFLVWLTYQEREKWLAELDLPERPTIPDGVSIGGHGQQPLAEA